MNSHFRRFEMLAVQTMAGDVLKDDVNGVTSCFFRGFLRRFAWVWGLYDGNKHSAEH